MNEKDDIEVSDDQWVELITPIVHNEGDSLVNEGVACVSDKW